MGIDVGDYDGDGLPDIWVTNFENEVNSLYRNLGKGQFMHAEAAAGLMGASRMRVGFGTALTDFDSDGWLDIFVLNGNPIYLNGKTPYKQAPELFHNREGRRFVNISAKGGTFFRQVHAGRGAAVGDLDDDGAPDLVIVPVNDAVRILRNRHLPQNYVSVRLVATRGEPAATGARVTVNYNSRRVARFVVQGAGYFSAFDPRLLLPVDDQAATAEVVVEWPGRGRERYRELGVRRNHVLREGRGEAVDELR
jgi:enediyne biosynthesis protein E4